MIPDLSRAFTMLTDRRVQRVFLASLAVAVALLIALFPLSELLVSTAGGTGHVWLDRLLDVMSLLGTAVLAWFMFPVVIAAVLGFLLDGVVEATERRHFPSLPPARGEGFLQALLSALSFGALVLGINLLSLPLYLIPGLNLPVFLLINSYLLGREYVELVLLRHAPRAELPALRRRHRGTLWLSGLITALLLLVPLLNLLAPIVGSAFAALRVLRRLPPAALAPPRSSA